MELPLISFRGQRIAIDTPETESLGAAQEIEERAEGDLIVFEIKGDSMEKLIMDGAKVVVDTTDRVISSGAIYALYVPWEGSIIRECHVEPGGLLLRPNNRNFPEALISWEEFDPQIVIGKVFCSVINVFR